MIRSVLAIFLGALAEVLIFNTLAAVCPLAAAWLWTRYSPAFWAPGTDMLAMETGARMWELLPALVVICGILGSYLGGYVAMSIHRERKLFIALLTGVVSLVSSLPFSGLSSSPQFWSIISLIFIVPATLAGGFHYCRRRKLPPLSATYNPAVPQAP